MSFGSMSFSSMSFGSMSLAPCHLAPCHLAPCHLAPCHLAPCHLAVIASGLSGPLGLTNSYFIIFQHEEAVKAMKFPYTSIFRPGMLDRPAASRRFGEKLASKRCVILLGRA